MAYPHPNLLPIGAGNTSQKLTLSGIHVQSAVVTNTETPVYYNVFATADAFVRAGTNPTAVATGVDQFIPSNLLFRLGPLKVGERFSFIAASAGGFVYLTPEN